MSVFLRASAFLVAGIVCAQEQSPLAARFDGRISAALAASGAPSVSVAIVENGRLAYAKAFGKADIAANRDAGVNTRYAIGSVSKQFTSTALLLLQEQGKLSLDDKVAKYFPELTRANEITIRQLLSHTSGYEDYAPQDYLIPDWTKPMTSEKIINQWARKPLNYDPGTKWQYSNTGYVLAALIFEKAAGLPLVAFLREKIFEPLGMKSADDCDIRSPEDASAYTRFALGPPRPVGREASSWYLGAGELCMTPSDLAKWDIAFINRRILSAKSYDELTGEVKLTNGQSTHYALGLSVGGTPDNREFSHDGEVSGFLTMNRVWLARRSALAVCSNEDGINLSSSVGQLIMQVWSEPADLAQVREILEGLQHARIDRALFTVNANSYFTDTALQDYQASLSSIGRLQSITKTSEQLRGGMSHRRYRAQYEKKSVLLNIYVTPDGKYEQFMVVEQL
jgi:CubicO group peptidase (beta-lactamase class C family)